MTAFPKQKRKLQNQVFFPITKLLDIALLEFLPSHLWRQLEEKKKHKPQNQNNPHQQQNYNNKKKVAPITFLINTENMLTM